MNMAIPKTALVLFVGAACSGGDGVANNATIEPMHTRLHRCRTVGQGGSTRAIGLMIKWLDDDVLANCATYYLCRSRSERGFSAVETRLLAAKNGNVTAKGIGKFAIIAIDSLGQFGGPKQLMALRRFQTIFTPKTRHDKMLVKHLKDTVDEMTKRMAKLLNRNSGRSQ